MPSLVIPEAGLSLESSREFSKPGMAVPPVFGLTLSDGVIEEMIKCFQENKPIQLSLGDAPKISYGSKTQNLSPSPDPFTHELYHTSNSLPDTLETMKITRVEQKYHPRFHAMFAPKHLKPKGRPVTSTQQSTSATKATASKSADDAALADLQRAMATETAKKAGNTTKYIKDGSLPLPGKRGAAATNKSKFLQQNRLGSDTTRSMPTSPALSSVGSPSLGATSVPLSQQKADQAKATRRPIIHLLAASPLTEVALRDKVEGTKNDIKLALEKVADLNSSTGMWELGKKFYKDLDVWAFQYPTNEQRQQAIDNAVKQYDKMRIGVTEPEWDRLLPKEERGTGKCLSKLQAAIATGTARPPKINVSKAEDSGRDTPMSNDKESLDDKPISRVKGESMARSVSNPPASKTKKTSEREAQTKRLFSNSKSKTAAPKAAAPAKTASAKKAKAPPKEEKGSALSSQFVEDSDDESEEKPVVTKPAPKAIKRQREDEVDTSDSSNVPLSKKVKKDPIITHRTSDVSHSSRSTNYSTSSKNKGTSPQKSSPLASSPPTNASEFEGESASNGRISSSASPYDAPTHTIKRKREDVDEQPVKRHASSSISSSASSARPMQRQKSSSVSSSDSSTTSHSGRLGLPNDIPILQDLQDLARRYKLYYPKYVALRSELAALHFHDPEKEDDCRNMFERLSKMKNDIFEMLRSQGLPTSKTHSVDWRPMTNGGKIDYRTSSINF